MAREDAALAVLSTAAGSCPGAALARLGEHLCAAGVKVLTTTTDAHAALLEAAVAHEHVLRASGRLLGLLQEASIVVGVLGPGPTPTGPTAEEQAVHALVRAAALQYDNYVVLTTPDQFPLLRRGLAGVNDSTRKQLAAAALRGLAARDLALAVQLSGMHLPTGDTVLVLGGGGREHAIATKLAESAHVKRVIVAPGNPGMTGRKIAVHPELALGDNAAVVRFVQEHDVKFVAVGPEQPLVDGVVDALAAAGVPAFGPSKLAARLEGSKAFCKAFMERHGIETAKYASFTDYEAAVKYVESVSHKVVIKASGLAAGKGVVLPDTVEEAKTELKRMMIDSVFGEAGAEVVVEERLEGQEVSVLGFCDGRSVVLLPGAQDHKRVFDGDEGPNTGGMGAYAPAPILTPELRASVALEVMQRAMDGAVQDGFPFVGILYAGIIVTSTGPKVLEFNCRFGDPETQVILPLLKSDLYEIMRSCVCGMLLASEVQFQDEFCAGVVLASKGYPAAYEKGKVITQKTSELAAGVTVYHAGTAQGKESGELVTNGGRVLVVSAKQTSLEAAIKQAYEELDAGKVGFEGAHFRRDIGKRALRAPVRLAVLGSTRGTDLQYVIDAIDQGWLRASIEVVVSNKKDAYILTRAENHGLKTVLHSMKGCANRTEFDAKVTATLKEFDVDLVLLIGYMRILSDEFVDEWAGRVINVHPSLLPEFAGGMDLNVHQEVIDAGKSVTGCTIHLVTKEVDGGPIVVQKRCPVHADDDADKLKARVQALEGPAFVEAINKFVEGQMPSESA